MAHNRLLKSLPVAKGNCTHVDIELSYSKGGANYFTGTTERRGIYLFIQPVTRSEHSVSFVAFTGFKKLVKEMARFNQKTMDTFVLDSELEASLLKHVLETNGIELQK